jgi:hypothetical protein
MISFKNLNGNTPLTVDVTTAKSVLELIQTITALSSWTPIEGEDCVRIVPLDGNVRVVVDGSTPTATVGFQVAEDAALDIEGNPLDNVKLIAETGTVSVLLQVGSYHQ